ncbi:MAG: protein phosphatase 2C domain-containing protein [Akkermansia sp.]|nr:protein phosphatase 2C domain-containing protein [Akkermansia sp.]
MNTRVTSFSNFQIAAACCQWIGGRDCQEDACYLHPAEDSNKAESFVAVLADGMGGVADGEKASRHVVDSFMCAYAGKCGGGVLSAETLAGCLSYANKSLGDLKNDGRIDKDAGATFIALSISNDTMNWLSVGDSLLYRQQGNTISKINTAHTWQWELDRRVNRGEMTPEEAEAAPGPRHALYSAVCGEEDLEAELTDDRPCRVGDRYIIASDGLLPLIKTGWESILNSPEVRTAPPVEVCNLLMDTLKQLRAPNQDNTSIIIIDVLPVENYTADYATVSLIGDRPTQQDNEACWKSDKAMLAVVADGAGGHAGGEQASRAAVDSLHNTWNKQLAAGVPPSRAEEILSEALLTAHREVIERAGGDAKFCGKCAIVVVYLCNGCYTVANVGDCRAYLAHQNKWKQLTIDDSLLRILLERGEVSPEEARDHPDQSCLTQALGTTGRVKPHVSSGDYAATDRFLLCCDGLWNQLPDDRWSMKNWQAGSPKAHSDLLSLMARQAMHAAAGKSDNVSAIWLHTLPAPPFFRIRKYHYFLGAVALLLGLAGAGTVYYVHQKNEKARIAAENAEAARKAEEAACKAAEEAARKAAVELARKVELFTTKLAELRAGLCDALPLVEEVAARVAGESAQLENTDLKGKLGPLVSIAREVKTLAADLPAENIDLVCNARLAKPEELNQRLCEFCRAATPTANALTEEHILHLLGWQAALQNAQRVKKEKERAADEGEVKEQPVKEGQPDNEEGKSSKQTVKEGQPDVEKDKARSILSQKHGIHGDYAQYVLTSYNNPDILRLLIAVGADVNATDENGYTALHYAAGENLIDCVKVLLNAPGIEVEKKAHNGKTPHMIAVENRHTECAERIKQGTPSDKMQQEELK